jgi:hypothetical protein
MAGNFDIAKFLKENHLGSFGILGKYVDLHGINEATDIDGLKLVKGAGTLRTRGEAEAIAKVAKDSGMTGVKIIEKGPKHFSVYADPEKSLKKEADSPFGMPDTSEENPWMDEVDGMEDYTVGEWKCYYDYPGVLAWSYGDTPFDQLAVYATPNFDTENTTPIQVDVNNESVENMSVPQGTFADFNEYASKMKPYLDKIESKYAGVNEGEPEGDQYDGKYDDQFGPAIANEAEDSFMKGKGIVSQLDDFDRMMGLIDSTLESQLPKIKKAVDASRARGLKDSSIFNMLMSNSLTGPSVKALVDDGFDSQDIVDFFATDFSMEEEVSVSSSGVEMEGVDNFNVDLQDMINNIKQGYGYIDPEYVEHTWEMTSEIPFASVKNKVLGALTKSGLLKSDIDEAGLNYTSAEEFDLEPQEGPNDPLGPNASKYPRADFADAVYAANQAGISKDELIRLVSQNAR